MHFQPRHSPPALPFGEQTRSFLPFLPLDFFLPFFFFMALKCYFQQLLSYKYLLFFFFSFPPGEKGRGPIENSALSLSVGFKYRSNNRSLLLFFFKFPVVLLAGSAVERNREGSCLYGDPLRVSQMAVLVCVFVCARLRPVIGWGDMRVCVHARVYLCAHDNKCSF